MSRRGSDDYAVCGSPAGFPAKVRHAGRTVDPTVFLADADLEETSETFDQRASEVTGSTAQSIPV